MIASGIPCITRDLLEEMERGSYALERAFAPHANDHGLDFLVIRSLHSKAFSVGGDFALFIDLIDRQNRDGLTDYANAAIAAQFRNYTGHGIRGVTTIALLEGDALGGGLECALSCDIVVAESHVRAGFPEVLFNMFPGMGGMSFLVRRAGQRVANEMVRSGRLYSAQELLEFGVVDELTQAGGGLDAVRRIVGRSQPQRLAQAAISSAARLVQPVPRSELEQIVGVWVDRALSLDDRGRAWMKRLLRHQSITFAKLPPAATADISRAA
jgi:DSF synthase